MAKWHKDNARRRRTLWLSIFGDECVACGKKDELTFDCIVSCGDAHHKYDSAKRMQFYEQQIAKRNIQILCHKCNSQKKDMDNDEFLKWKGIKIAEHRRKQREYHQKHKATIRLKRKQGKKVDYDDTGL